MADERITSFFVVLNAANFRSRGSQFVLRKKKHYESIRLWKYRCLVWPAPILWSRHWSRRPTHSPRWTQLVPGLIQPTVLRMGLTLALPSSDWFNEWRNWLNSKTRCSNRSDRYLLTVLRIFFQSQSILRAGYLGDGEAFGGADEL